MMPDPLRLSAVSRSPLVRAGSRWLSLARGLSRGRSRRAAAANTLAFIESLYGGRFKPFEGGAFPLDKVYRTAGGGLFVSETRLSVSVQPRFDLRLLNVLNVAGARHGSQAFKELPAVTSPSPYGVSGREQRPDARRVTNSIINAPSLTVQTWNVLPPGGERVSTAFGYVSARVPRARQAPWPESSRPAVRDGRPKGTSAETSRPTVPPAPASLRLTSIDLRQFVTHAARREFVSLLLNTHLPAVISREVTNVRTTREWSYAPTVGAVVHEATGRRFSPVVQRRRPAAWAYAEPAPRHALPRVLPPASLMLSLSETSLTVFAVAAGTPGQTIYRPGGRTPALSIQHLRTHTATAGTRERAATVEAPRLPGRTPQSQPTVTRDILSSLHTFVERVQTSVAAITHGGGSTVFARVGFEPAPRRGLKRVQVRRHGAPNESAPRQAAPPHHLGRSIEFVRRPPFADSRRASSTRDAGTQVRPDQTPGAFSAQGAPGVKTFHFSKTLLLRSERGTAAAEAERALRETRAARPEGMALELIRHRREQVLQLPRPGYVFTPPARGQLEERQVITKASREEIVEVVRREVRSLAAAAPAMPAPSRADLAGIADEVYSTLVRRLLVEKERLGRF
jgi:hypothetical protein